MPNSMAGIQAASTASVSAALQNARMSMMPVTARTSPGTPSTEVTIASGP